jgi:hypothetical protein
MSRRAYVSADATLGDPEASTNYREFCAREK